MVIQPQSVHADLDLAHRFTETADWDADGLCPGWSGRLREEQIQQTITKSNSTAFGSALIPLNYPGYGADADFWGIFQTRSEKVCAISLNTRADLDMF